MYDFKIFAFDGSKIKANCSKKNVFTLDKIDELLANIDKKIDEYIDKIEIDYSQYDDAQIASFKEKLERIKNRKIKYLGIKEHMINNDIDEFASSDPDSKLMKNHSNIEPCYNLQTVVDSKHKLIADFDVTNQANDVGLLKPMSDKLFNDYNLNDFLLQNPEHSILQLADTGFFKTSDILALNTDRVSTLVPKPKSASPSPLVDFSKSAFSYSPTNDTYTCPNNQILTFYRKSTETRNNITNYYKIYTCNACTNCPFLDKCTKSIHGRSIKRNIHEDKLLNIDQIYKNDSSFYKLRKALVEHPYGTIKSTLGFYRVFVKGLDRILSWASSVCLAYNFKRVINIVGVKKLVETFTTS